MNYRWDQSASIAQADDESDLNVYSQQFAERQFADSR
jgi:hypothetical protein